MKRFSRRIIASFSLLGALMLPLSTRAAFGTQQSPKLMNLYFDWQLKNENQVALAKWDVVVLDMDFGWQFPERIRKLRHDNPNIKILAYVSAGELADARAKGDPASPGYVLAKLATENAFLHSTTGTRLSDWPGSELMNVTDAGPSTSAKWNQILPTFIQSQLMPTKLWDGIFLDTAYDSISSRVQSAIDVNGDGKADSPADVDRAWNAGMKALIQRVRTAIGPNRLLMENGGITYAPLVNGVLFENFPSTDWNSSMGAYHVALGETMTPSLTAINANTMNQQTQESYQLFRYGFTSALLEDGYFSFDSGDKGHAQTWWYDEYDAFLGAASGTSKLVASATSGTPLGVWERPYAHGMVLVNTDSAPHAVDLPGLYEKIRGTQDPATNDGSYLHAVTVPAHDGVVLLAPLAATDIREASFVQGSSYRVFSPTGNLIRQGFSANSTGALKGSSVVYLGNGDVNPLNRVVTQAGRVTIFQAGKFTQTIAPFGSAFKGAMSVALSQPDKSGKRLVAAERTDGISNSVCVFTFSGVKQSCWMPEGVASTSTKIEIGNVDGGGERIIQTSMVDGAVRVRQYSFAGTLIGKEFMAYSSGDQGGTSLAVADVDGDKHDEIVVGSGANSMPRARIFDANGTVRRELRFGATTSTQATTIVATDMNRDGVAEILVAR